MSSNFGFLEESETELYELAMGAEDLLHHSPKTTLRELRTFGEVLIQRLLDDPGVNASGTQHDKLVMLEDRGHLPEHIAGCLHEIRIRGNDASHDNTGTRERAQRQLRNAWTAAVWFHQRHAASGSPPTDFTVPSPPEPDDSNTEEQVRAEVDALERRLDAIEGQREQSSGASEEVDQLKARIEELENTQSSSPQNTTDSTQASTSVSSGPSMLQRIGQSIRSGTRTTIKTLRRAGQRLVRGLRRLLVAIWKTIRRMVRFAVLTIAVGAFFLYVPTIYDTGTSLLPEDAVASLPPTRTVEEAHHRVLPPDTRRQIESLAADGWRVFRRKSLELGRDLQEFTTDYWKKEKSGDNPSPSK